ncbi:hypothetical protein BDV32DRAFT_128664, partial [Aspergillus pseudonomiae]
MRLLAKCFNRTVRISRRGIQEASVPFYMVLPQSHMKVLSRCFSQTEPISKLGMGDLRRHCSRLLARGISPLSSCFFNTLRRLMFVTGIVIHQWQWQMQMVQRRSSSYSAKGVLAIYL